ncbi:MAG: hypothetical protein UY81_C0006G0006 [Candidatus Giovannonibacteria bacterium GW2011_GWA2_53_7]|uniref:Uncharacterized protein n=1 Tax=Candidatus Giovannonibacteria bacterium GW2011_GWA2_53_7 TaxID=1618650 RepID=A0A0G2A7X8_9BACT|nr:MAG: hypothetical protein UY81_C0006G0006 [Candidatus Giovannonibacteria bacterium GW2011_GWA2_53_7]
MGTSIFPRGVPLRKIRSQTSVVFERAYLEVRPPNRPGRQRRSAPKKTVGCNCLLTYVFDPAKRPLEVLQNDINDRLFFIRSEQDEIF